MRHGTYIKESWYTYGGRANGFCDVYMCVYINIFEYVYASIDINVIMYMPVYIYVNVYMRVDVYVNAYVHVHIYIYTCVHARMYVCTCKNIHSDIWVKVCLCMYIYLFNVYLAM